jgi:hypothetical protein
MVAYLFVRYCVSVERCFGIDLLGGGGEREREKRKEEAARFLWLFSIMAVGTATRRGGGEELLLVAVVACLAGRYMQICLEKTSPLLAAARKHGPYRA